MENKNGLTSEQIETLSKVILDNYISVYEQENEEEFSPFEHGWNIGYLQGFETLLNILDIKIKGINAIK